MGSRACACTAPPWALGARPRALGAVASCALHLGMAAMSAPDELVLWQGPGPLVAGVVHGLSNEAYHAGAGLSVSGAKRLLKTPYHFHALAGPHGAPASEPTAAMVNGTLVHCALLEPELFDVRYAVGPEVASRAVKEWKAFVAANPGREPITPLQRDRAYAQAAALRALPDVGKLLRRGHAESSAYWVDPATGVHCKCRPDFAAHGWGAAGAAVILVDVKTTSDASPEGFAKSVVNYAYHMQAAWYCEGYALATGCTVLGMVFAAVESEYPHAAAAYTLDAQAVELGAKLNHRARTVYAKCSTSGEWPSYPNEVIELSLPRWAWSALND